MTTEHSCTVVPIQDYSFKADIERWNKQSIYKIPESIVTSKPEAYKPQMVSMGPYHYDAPNLQRMETHKLRALHHIQSSGVTLDFLCQKLCQDVKDLKGAYDQLDDKKWSNNMEFVELMVKDGCFILELLRMSAADDQTSQDANSKKDPMPSDQTLQDAYPKNDPIFSKHGWLNIVPYLKRDMLMLENQIPMTVLKTLDGIIYPPDRVPKPAGLIKQILRFFSLPLSHEDKFGSCLHILDLYRESLISKPGDGTNPGEDGKIIPPGEDDKIIRSATELNNAGVTIKKSKSNSLRDISFGEGLLGAQLNLPLILVDDAFESLYLNLIAYERFHVKTGEDNVVTAYLILMDSIIDSVQDVALLHSSDVIQNALSSDKAVAKLFNSLSTDSTLDLSSDLGKVHVRVHKFCKKRVPRWRAFCCQQYCSNPLVAITVIAAILIFIMTVLQTGYNVFDHIKKPPK